MAEINAIGTDYSNESDGFKLGGGTTVRTLTFTGADMTMTGSGTNVFTFPSATDTLVGLTSTDTLTNKTLTDATNSFRAASLTTDGTVELATTAEINTGTDSTRAIPIDQYVASNRNIKYFTVILIASDTNVAVDTTVGGDFRVPFTGTLLQSDTNKYLLSAYNDTAGITGTMVVDIHLNGTTIMATNKLDIETTEKTTADATTQPDLTTTAVTEGDILTFDIDAIHSGTAAKGLKVTFAIRQT